VLSFIGGSTVAAFVTRCLNWRRERIELTIKLTHDYLDTYYSLHVQVQILLAQQPDSWSINDTTHLIKLGNWFEIVSALYNTNNVDKSLIKRMGLDGLITEFYPAVNTPEVRQQLEDTVGQWKEMQVFFHNKKD